MPDPTLTIQLEGSIDDQGHVRLDDLIEELDAIKSALRNTERIVTGKQNSVFYRVIDLTHSSPSRLRIAGIARRAQDHQIPRRIFRKFSTSMRMIQRRNRMPDDFDPETIDAYKRMAVPLRRHLRVLRITDDERNKQSSVDSSFEETVDRILGEDQRELGSVSGMLEKVNLHANANKFHIFPTIGARVIACRFKKKEIKAKVENSVGKYVRVDGWVIYKQTQRYPYAVLVEDIEPYPPVSELPNMSDLRGIAPNATEGMKSEDFVRKLRDGSW